MPFDYYRRLSPRNQRIYRASDAVTQVRLPHPHLLYPFVDLLGEALGQDRRSAVEAASGRLVLGMFEMLDVPPVTVQVLAARPSLRYGELHGLYTNDPPKPPRIQVWMRTAASPPGGGLPHFPPHRCSTRSATISTTRT